MNPNLDVYTIEAVLLAKSLSDQKRMSVYSQRVNEVMGIKPQVASENDLEFVNKALRLMAKTVAERLVANDRSVPVFSLNDLDGLFSDFINVKVGNDKDIDPKDRLKMEEIIKNSLNGMFKNLMKLVDDGSDQYDEFWRTINVICNLANDEMLPLGQPLTDELYDEVVRRLYTREQYTTLYEKLAKVVTDPETMLKTFIEPMFGMFGDDLEESDRAELIDELKAKIAPLFEKVAIAGKEIMNEEIDRLYQM